MAVWPWWREWNGACASGSWTLLPHRRTIGGGSPIGLFLSRRRVATRIVSLNMCHAMSVWPCRVVPCSLCTALSKLICPTSAAIASGDSEPADHQTMVCYIALDQLLQQREQQANLQLSGLLALSWPSKTLGKDCVRSCTSTVLKSVSTVLKSGLVIVQQEVDNASQQPEAEQSTTPYSPKSPKSFGYLQDAGAYPRLHRALEVTTCGLCKGSR